MKDNVILGVILTCGIIAMCAVAYVLGKERGYQNGYETAINLPHKPDTVYRTKVVTVEKPVPVVKWKEREKPVYVPVNKDSLVYVHDTTYMPLSREFRQYSGEEYEAQISGIDPSLDWIKINQKTAYITNTVTSRKRWGFNVTAGAGVYWNGSQIQPGLGITAGFGYSF